jgi:cytoskeletal protein RodZ
MNWFAEELHKQRVTKGISLNEIASITRINIHFLESLEQGNFEALSQTYIRAFIREYATCVGLNPVEALQRYDLFLGKKLEPVPDTYESQEKSPQWQRASRSDASSTSVQRASRSDASSTLVPRVAKIVLATIVLLVGGFTCIYFFFRPSDSQPVRQVAFDDVVNETERASTPPQTVTPRVNPGSLQAVSDSLHLSSTTSDTVWISIIIDGKRTEEYLFPPKSKCSWTAKEKFSITLGNAGGIHFTLNGTPLEPLGRLRAVVRNVIISKENIRQPNGERQTIPR